MATTEKVFSRGDWIVHSYYGVGKVKKIEKKKIDGEKKKFYRVESDMTTYWIPLEGASESHIRAAATRTSLRRALNLLTQKPAEMDAHFKARQSRIEEVLANCNLREMIKLVRDLWARGQVEKLGALELSALQQAMDNLVVEIALAEGICNMEASSKLLGLLSEQTEEPSMGSSAGVVRKFLRRDRKSN